MRASSASGEKTAGRTVAFSRRDLERAYALRKDESCYCLPRTITWDSPATRGLPPLESPRPDNMAPEQ